MPRIRKEDKMAGPNFFETRMGRNFYERSIPSIMNSLSRIATQLEKKDISFEKDSNDYPTRLVGSSTDDPQYPGLLIDLEKDNKTRPVVRVEHNDALEKIFIYIWENEEDDFSQKITIDMRGEVENEKWMESN